MAFRITADILLFISALFLPWWVVSILVVVFLFYFPKYYEAIFVGLMLDSVFGASVTTLIGFQFFFSAFYTVLYVAVELIKSNMRLENKTTL